jgi:hypothetical protein
MQAAHPQGQGHQPLLLQLGPLLQLLLRQPGSPAHALRWLPVQQQPRLLQLRWQPQPLLQLRLRGWSGAAVRQVGAKPGQNWWMHHCLGPSGDGGGSGLPVPQPQQHLLRQLLAWFRRRLLLPVLLLLAGPSPTACECA